jgi:hypothetical protein
MSRYNLQGTIEEITITRNNTKIQLTGNNTRNNNHKEQYQKYKLHGAIEEITITRYCSL